MGFQEIMTSLQNGSCAPESVTHACMRFHRRKHKVVHQHAQIRFPSHLRILFLMALISMSPKSDSGEHNAHPNLALTPPRALPLPMEVIHCKSRTHARARAHTDTNTYVRARPPQRSRQAPNRSLKAPFRRVSNGSQNLAIGVHMARSGIGKYQVSPTWLRCSLVQICLMVTFRSGTCQA